MKRISAVMLVVALLVVPVAQSGAAEKRVEGSFTAEASPLPQRVSWEPACTIRAASFAGVDGVNRVVEPFTAPFSGWLAVTATFTGDWDLGLLGEAGDALGWSVYQESMTEDREVMSYFVRKGETVGIAVCNVLSASPAEVEYVLTSSRPWRRAPGRSYTERTEERRYIAPSIATKDVFVQCEWSWGIGCPESSRVDTGDRSVAVDISDDSGGEVSAQIYQHAAGSLFTFMGVESFCTSTDEPVALKPGTTHVGVLILMGPCESGIPATATQGTYTVTFSHRK